MDRVLTSKFKVLVISHFELARMIEPYHLVGSDMNREDLIELIQLGNSISYSDAPSCSKTAASLILDTYLCDHTFDEACYQIASEYYSDLGLRIASPMSIDEINTRIHSRSCDISIWNPKPPKRIWKEEVVETSQANHKSFNHVMKLEVSCECGAGNIYIDMTRIKYDAASNTITLFGAPQTLPSWIFKYKGPIYTYIMTHRDRDKKKLEGLKSGSLETIETNKYWTKIVINN